MDTKITTVQKTTQMDQPEEEEVNAFSKFGFFLKKTFREERYNIK